MKRYKEGEKVGAKKCFIPGDGVKKTE